MRFSPHSQLERCGKNQKTHIVNIIFCFAPDRLLHLQETKPNSLSFGWNSFKGTTKARHQDKWKRSMSYTYVWYSLLSKKVQMKISNFVWNNCFCEIIAFGIYFSRVHIAILRAHVYTLRTYFVISFLVSIGRAEHHSCESRQIITRRRLKMEIMLSR